jgi:hypothetical protein
MARNEFSMTRVQGRPKQERKCSNMKNRNIQLTGILFVVGLALAPIVQAAPRGEGGPTHPPVFATNPRVSDNSEAIPETPAITIHSTDNVRRGKIGTFVLNMSGVRLLGGMYVKFSVSGTAVQGADYVALVSPAYIGQSGYGVIQIQTLLDPRGSSNRQAYSVVITLDDGAGYALGVPSSATMWIKP